MKPSLIGDRPQFAETLSETQRGSYYYMLCFSAVIPHPSECNHKVNFEVTMPDFLIRCTFLLVRMRESKVVGIVFTVDLVLE